MKISYLWLREYIDLAASPEELRDSLSAVGLVVESAQAVGDDAVLDIEVPSNRPDCLNHIGIAREVATIYDCDLKIPLPQNPDGREFFSIVIEDADLCRRYSGRVIRGVKIQESPPWLNKRLSAIGQRPINNIVDITNYVLMEMGHPLHAFDLDKLQGPEIIVRRARPGEKLRTLDGVERDLDPEKLVIADARRPVALAGIIGGEWTEISSSTTNLLIESAYFDPASIGRSARDLQMRTEASHRFERGADPGATVPALQRCVELILKLAGGGVATPVIDILPSPGSALCVPLRRERMKSYSVIEIPDNFVRCTLERLGFRLQEDVQGWMVTVPGHRVDICLEEDLIEDVLRHYGYDKIPSSLPPWKEKGSFLPETERRSRLGELFRALGYSETLNWTFTDPDLESAFGYSELPVTLKNPLSSGASQLRTHLVPNLALVARYNQNHGQETIRLFEIGKTFIRRSGKVLERESVAWVAMGAEQRKFWSQHDDPLNYFYMKGVLEALARRAPLSVPDLRAAQISFLNPAQSAEMHRNGEPVGYLGCLHPDLQEQLKLKEPLFLGEFDLSKLGAVASASVGYQPISRYPGVFRDFSSLVDREIPFGSLLKYLFEHRVPHFRYAELIDFYDSEQLPSGKVSLTIRFFFESSERTLTDAEIQQAHEQMVKGLRGKFGLIPR
ncbi:MAG: phenylalanine--tRNA ligase subunit beta [Acidobacteria bacterium]|nr:phenylalanine--tRNA ligase subunit beta [Acidobacteriota bacterium]